MVLKLHGSNTSAYNKEMTRNPIVFSVNNICSHTTSNIWSHNCVSVDKRALRKARNWGLDYRGRRIQTYINFCLHKQAHT